MPAANGDPKAHRSRCGCMISSSSNLAAPCPTASTTSARIPAGSALVSITTRRASQSMPSAAGGRPWGQARYRNAKSLLITADGGGSNGTRLRLWKLELQRLADELGLAITVCHLPPGTSKWNKIEHRLFSFITQNWRGKPLISHQVIVQLIAATTTKTGLTVHAELDPNPYHAGITVNDAEFAAINLTRHDFHGEWDCAITPHALSI